jgi:hypothetical protein
LELFRPAPKRFSPNGVFGYARPIPNPGLSQLSPLSDGPEEKPDPVGPEEKRTGEQATRSYSNLTRRDGGGEAAGDGARRSGLATCGGGDGNGNASISGSELVFSVAHANETSWWWRRV